MFSRYKVATAALVLSALAGFGMHQARAGVLGLNMRLLAPWSKFTSAADAICASLWVTEAQNDPALRCYLTVNVARLCDAGERLHLAHILRRYRRDAAMLSVNAVVSVVKPMTMPVATPRKLSQAETELKTRMNDRSGARRDMTALREVTEKRMDNIVKARPATLDAALEVETLARDELVGPLRLIALAGRMQKGDFGWMPGSLVDEAFEGVGASRGCADFLKAGQSDER
jgi:hypothetical protein